MPRPKKQPSPTIPPRALETLVALSLGEIEVATAAQIMGQTEDAFIEFVEAHPDLVKEAEGIAREQRLDPERTLARSNAGLSAAIETLAARLETSGSDMPTSELVQASSLLEKLIGLSESRRQEIKNASASETEDEKLPIFISDTRPNPKTKEPRMLVLLVEPEDPRWVDFSNPKFQKPNFCWLEHHLPLSPKTGEPIDLALLTSGTGTIKYLDSNGRVHGAHR